MNNELYHYGVKGMKWGVRKSKEERYRDWKKKQHSRLDSQTSKDQEKWDKKITKAELEIAKKGSTDVRQIKLRTLEGKKQASKALNKIGHDEVDKLGQSDYDEIVKRQTTATIASVTSIALASVGTIPLGYLHIPITNLNFKDYRVRHSDLESPNINS